MLILKQGNISCYFSYHMFNKMHKANIFIDLFWYELI